MIRIIAICAVGLAVLASCTEYKEPRANCFNFIAPAPGEKDCAFEPLGAPENAMTGLE